MKKCMLCGYEVEDNVMQCQQCGSVQFTPIGGGNQAEEDPWASLGFEDTPSKSQPQQRPNPRPAGQYPNQQRKNPPRPQMPNHPQQRPDQSQYNLNRQNQNVPNRPNIQYRNPNNPVTNPNMGNTPHRLPQQRNVNTGGQRPVSGNNQTNPYGQRSAQPQQGGRADDQFNPYNQGKQRPVQPQQGGRVDNQYNPYNQQSQNRPMNNSRMNNGFNLQVPNNGMGMNGNGGMRSPVDPRGMNSSQMGNMNDGMNNGLNQTSGVQMEDENVKKGKWGKKDKRNKKDKAVNLNNPNMNPMEPSKPNGNQIIIGDGNEYNPRANLYPGEYDVAMNDVTLKEWIILTLKMLIPIYNIYIFITLLAGGAKYKPSMVSYMRASTIVMVTVAGIMFIVTKILL